MRIVFTYYTTEKDESYTLETCTCILAMLGLFRLVLHVCRKTLNRHGSRLKYFRKKSRTWLKFFLAPARNHSVESLMRAVGDQMKHFILYHTIRYYWYFDLFIKGYLKIRRSWSSTSPPGKSGRPPLAISVKKKKKRKVWQEILLIQ